jgi:hypothetical protein
MRREIAKQITLIVLPCSMFYGPPDGTLLMDELKAQHRSLPKVSGCVVASYNQKCPFAQCYFQSHIYPGILICVVTWHLVQPEPEPEPECVETAGDTEQGAEPDSIHLAGNIFHGNHPPPRTFNVERLELVSSSHEFPYSVWVDYTR